ncbi:MAG: hypothetical protein LBV67_06120 [Streptococcaceae bacterium]|jgi:hypothetical protein|nr:hypothetical protein [Streptococcaceae bacterium]
MNGDKKKRHQKQLKKLEKETYWKIYPEKIKKQKRKIYYKELALICPNCKTKYELEDAPVTFVGERYCRVCMGKYSNIVLLEETKVRKYKYVKVKSE